MRGRQRLSEAGVPLRAEDYEIGHAIEPGEMRHAVEWMEEVLAGTDVR